MTDRYCWRFDAHETRNDDEGVLTLGMGSRSFWEQYGDECTILAWDSDDEGDR